MELDISSQNDRDIMGTYNTQIDLWYALQRAVRKFAEWTRGRMDFPTYKGADTEFSSVIAALQLSEDGEVTLFFSCQCKLDFVINSVVCFLSVHLSVCDKYN